MLDALSTYAAEIQAIEDGWFADYARSPDRRGWSRPGSTWGKNWDRLDEIDERHGIAPHDPRAYSIAAFRDEMHAIEADREREHRAYLAAVRADPTADPPYGEQSFRYFWRLDDCDARHFPRLDLTAARSRMRDPWLRFFDERFTADSLPKLWRQIQSEMGLIQNYLTLGHGLSQNLGVAREAAEIVYSLLRSHCLDWAPLPENYHPPSFTVARYLAQLEDFANRLERDEAARLLIDLCRGFAPASMACLRRVEAMPPPEPPGRAGDEDMPTFPDGHAPDAPKAALTPSGRALAAAVDLKKQGRPVSLKAACELAGVDRKNIRTRHPDTVKAIRAMAAPDRTPRRATRDRRTGNLDAVEMGDD